MPRTPAKAPALSFVLLLGTAACASGGRAPSAPAPAAPVPAQPVQAPEQIQEPFQITAAPSRGPVRGNLLGNVRYDLPVQANRWVEMELDFLVNQRRAVIGRWLERAGRYQSFVEETFASYGIPRDLHHLAMVESGYSPTARSHAGAVGMWQFMPATGRGMGLRIDDVVDERMDPVRATHAAARHLRDLHRDFRGDWALAAAAYNAGGGRINRGLGRFNVTNFWDLAERGDLAQETRHYVPRLFAVTIIGRDPVRFGYPAAAPGRRFRPDSIRVDIETPVAELARIANLNVTELTELNPHLFRGIAPAGYKVWAPTGSGAAIQAAFDTSAYRRSGGYAWYTLRPGENAAVVATAAGITIDRMRELNLSAAVERLRSGDRVRLPAPAVRTLAARPQERTRLASAYDEPRGPSSPEMEAARAEARRTRAARREAERAAEARRAEEREARRAEERAAAARRLAAREAARAEEAAARRSASRSEDSASSARRTASRADDDETPARRTASRTEDTEAPARRTAARSEEAEASTRRAARDEDSSRVAAGSDERSSARRSADSTDAPRARRAAEGAESARTTRGSEERVASRASASAERPAAARPRRAEREDSSSESTARTASRETARRSGDDEERAPARARMHTVARGETLRGLAEKYGVTTSQLRQANDIPSGQGVEVGQRLRLPRAAASPATLAVERAARTRTSADESGTSARRTTRSDSASRRSRATADDDAPSPRSATERRASRDSTPSRTRTAATRDSSTLRTRTAARDSAGSRPRTAARDSSATRAGNRDASGSRTAAARDSSASRTRMSATRDSSTSRTRSAAKRDSASTRSRTAARDSAGSRTRTASPREASSSTASTRPSQHTVKSGETLYSIARQYGVDVDTLREANDLSAANTIQPGQKLRVPRS